MFLGCFLRNPPCPAVLVKDTLNTTYSLPCFFPALQPYNYRISQVEMNPCSRNIAGVLPPHPLL